MRFRDNSVCSQARIDHLLSRARALGDLPGAMAEVGVYLGGTARMLASTCPGRMLHLFDTFRGLPAEMVSERDGHLAGDFDDCSEAETRAFLHGLNVTFHVGIFPGTAEPVREESFALVHVDCDLYLSVLESLRFFWPRIVPGGVIVVDDFGGFRTQGATEAVLEFCEATRVRHKIVEPDNGHGACLVKERT